MRYHFRILVFALCSSCTGIWQLRRLARSGVTGVMIGIEPKSTHIGGSRALYGCGPLPLHGRDGWDGKGLAARRRGRGRPGCRMAERAREAGCTGSAT